jgi:hypothetical protein
MTLLMIQKRLEEYTEKIKFEVDVDINELEEINQQILLFEKEMTAEIARSLKKSIDEINCFVDDQRREVQKLLTGMSTGKKAIGRYKNQKLKTSSRFVYRKA